MKFKDVDLEELIRLMTDHDIAEISLKVGKTAVEVKRSKEPALLYPGSHLPSTLETVPDMKHDKEEVQEQEVEVPSVSPEESADQEGYHIVEAPLVGTFYRASAPDEDPFVEEGDTVKHGDVLCIVEAMKSMNEIQSDVDGVIKKICVDNADLVEFEQALFMIETPG